MAKKHKGNPNRAVEKAADRHPHFAGHRSGGHDVAAEHHADTSPQPGQYAFSADQEAAMRDNSGAPQGDTGMPMQPADGGLDDDGDE